VLGDRTWLRRAAPWAGCAIFAVALVACGGGGSPGEGPLTDAGASPDVTPEAGGPGDAGAGDARVAVGNDSGGSDDAQPGEDATGPLVVPPPPGPPGQDIVTGGVVASSPNYTLYATMGEGPGGNGTMSSTHYTLIGGLLGTTQQ
jgi:hypothetical protein